MPLRVFLCRSDLFPMPVRKIHDGPELREYLKKAIVVPSPIDHCARHRRAFSASLSVHEEFQSRVVEERNGRGGAPGARDCQLGDLASGVERASAGADQHRTLSKILRTTPHRYEFLSLTDNSFNAASNDYRWQPSDSAATMKPLARATAPAATATARLLQMKQLAKRFTAWEVVEGERCELRLMPSPIERYTPG